MVGEPRRICGVLDLGGQGCAWAPSRRHRGRRRLGLMEAQLAQVTVCTGGGGSKAGNALFWCMVVEGSMQEQHGEDMGL